MTSGFGSFAHEFLVRAREECPRAALLILGVAGSGPGFETASTGAAASGSGDEDDDTGRHDGSDDAAAARRGEAGSGAPVDTQTGVHARYARAVRAVNLGLAFSAFGAESGGLGALFIPVCPGALSPGAAAASALAGGAGAAADFAVAAAWDTLLLPLRRGDSAAWSEERGDVLECSRGPAAFTRREGQAVWARGPSQQTAEGGRDSRQPHRMGGSGASQARTAPAPLAALAPHIGLPELVAFLRTSSTATVAALSLALDSPSPDADARAVADAQSAPACRPAHLGGFAVRGLAPLQASWLWASSPLVGVAPPAVRAASDSRAVLDADGALRPLAHVLVSRGVGGLAMADAAGSRYASSCAAYGEALDAFLGRSLCARAAHAALRSPLCIPTDVDAYLGAWGAGGGGAVPRASLSTDAPAASAGLVRLYDASAGSAASADSAGGGGLLPPGTALQAVPRVLRSATAHVQCGPAYVAALRRLQSDYVARDPRVLHLYVGAGDGADVREMLAQAQEDVACFVDEYET